MKITVIIILNLICLISSMAQTWEGTSTPTTTSDYNTSIQLAHIGWGSHHGLLFNAYKSATLVDGFLHTPGNTKHKFEAGPWASGAGAITFVGNGGRMDFLISNPSTGIGQNVDWGASKMTINRAGVGIGTEDPVGFFDVRRPNAVSGQTVDVAYFSFQGENHFDGPGIFSEGKLVLGSKSYGNAILRRAEIGYSTTGSWRGGMLKFYTSPDDDSFTPIVRMTINQHGYVGIGTTNPTQKLTVNGTVYSTEVKVDVNAGTGPDYVFEPTYQLPTLTEIENYIKANKHLPEVPSAKEMEANGINLSEMNMLLLKKVEELTLYLIEQQNQINKQQQQLLKQQNQIQELLTKSN